MSDAYPRSRPDARGFSTCAIRAASRVVKLDQTPTSVPIYQTAVPLRSTGGATWTPGLLRVSVGLEDLEDLEADFTAALASAAAVTGRPVPALGAV